MSLTDTLGSLAVASHGQYMTGVSTDISTSFVKPAGKPGDELRMVATLTAMGAFIVMLLSPLVFGDNPVLRLLYPRKVAGIHTGRFYQPGGAAGCLRECVPSHTFRVAWLTVPWLAHTKYVGRSTGHSVRHLYRISHADLSLSS